MKIKNLAIILIFCLGILVRFYNYEKRIVYGPEQAMSLIVSGNNIREKPSLLGQEYFVRKTLAGHVLFAGAIFNYSLIPLQYLVKHDITLITSYFTLLNIFTGILLYIIVKKIIGEKVAIFSSFLFLFDPIMINHSLFLWNYNYLPLVFLLSLNLTHGLINNFKFIKVFFLGILSGLGVSLQFLYVIPLVLFLVLATVFRYKLNKKRNVYKIIFEKIIIILMFLSGIVLGNLPMVVFDLRHNFYHLKTAFSYFTQIMLGGLGEGFSYYHFLYLWIIFALIGGVILNILFVKKKILGVFAILGYLFLSINSSYFDLKKSTGMPEGLVAKDIYKASKLISFESDKCKSFNVVETQDFNTRAHVLRYPLIFKYGKVPLQFSEYKQADCIFALSESEYDFVDTDVWELTEFKPFKVNKIADIGSGYSLFKLEHE